MTDDLRLRVAKRLRDMWWGSPNAEEAWLALADAVLPLLEDDRRCWGCVEYGNYDPECTCSKRLAARARFVGEEK